MFSMAGLRPGKERALARKADDPCKGMTGLGKEDLLKALKRLSESTHDRANLLEISSLTRSDMRLKERSLMVRDATF